MSVLESQCQGLFESLIKNTSPCDSKILNFNQRHPTFQKNVVKPSLEAVLAKFKKLTSRTKNCAPPKGIYLLKFSALGKISYISFKNLIKLKRNSFVIHLLTHNQLFKRFFNISITYSLKVCSTPSKVNKSLPSPSPVLTVGISPLVVIPPNDFSKGWQQLKILIVFTTKDGPPPPLIHPPPLVLR